MPEYQTEKQSWKRISIWQRGLAMLFFAFVAGFVRLGITLLAIGQFITLLFTSKPNSAMLAFGQSFNTYLYQINQFLTANTNQYPFPFAKFPTNEPNVYKV